MWKLETCYDFDIHNSITNNVMRIYLNKNNDTKTAMEIVSLCKRIGCEWVLITKQDHTRIIYISLCTLVTYRHSKYTLDIYSSVVNCTFGMVINP